MNWNDITCPARARLRVQKNNNNENVSINFFCKCPEIKQETIKIQCINIKFIFIKIINNNFRNTPSESIFVSVGTFEFHIMTSGDKQRLLCYRLNVNEKEINITIYPTTLIYYMYSIIVFNDSLKTL